MVAAVRAVAAKIVDAVRPTRHRAEQLAKVARQFAPVLRRTPQPLPHSADGWRRLTALAQYRRVITRLERLSHRRTYQVQIQVRCTGQQTCFIKQPRQLESVLEEPA